MSADMEEGAAAARLTPYQRRARCKRSPRRSTRVHRCGEVLPDGYRCRTRAAAGADRCLMHAEPTT